MRKYKFLLMSLFCLLCGTVLAGEKLELYQKIKNPLSDLSRIGFQNTLYGRFKHVKRRPNVFNIEPIIPFRLNCDWNLITDTNIPVINTPWPIRSHGVGDINTTFLLSPACSHHYFWGAGLIFQFPSATDMRLMDGHLNTLGTGKWCVGPAVAASYVNGPWILGISAKHFWSFGGSGHSTLSFVAPHSHYRERDFMDRYGHEHVSLTQIQPFISYYMNNNFGYIRFAPLITANWEERKGSVWTIPLGITVGGLASLCGYHFDLATSLYYHVVHPRFSPRGSFTIELTLPFCSLR